MHHPKQGPDRFREGLTARFIAAGLCGLPDFALRTNAYSTGKEEWVALGKGSGRIGKVRHERRWLSTQWSPLRRDKTTFVSSTETNVHGDALFFLVMGPSLRQWLAVGGWWRLVAVGGGWRGWWSLRLSLRAVLSKKKKKSGFLRTALECGIADRRVARPKVAAEGVRHLTMLLLPHPEGPTNATVEPGST